MYNPPVVKNGVKVYRLRSFYKRRVFLVLVFWLMMITLLYFGISLNYKGTQWVDTYFLFIGVIAAVYFTILFFWIQYQSFVFRLEITSEGGHLFGLGKTICFMWQDANILDYVYWHNDNKLTLCLGLKNSSVKNAFRLPAKYFFPIQFTEAIIPVDSLYSYEPLKLKGKRALPTPDECSIHLRYFLQTPMGQDIIQFAPHVLGEVLHNYLPDNDLQHG